MFAQLVELLGSVNAEPVPDQQETSEESDIDRMSWAHSSASVGAVACSVRRPLTWQISVSSLKKGGA